MGQRMKIKTSELTGAALDWAVAKCEFPEPDYDDEWRLANTSPDGNEWAFQPSTDWAQGGPIIEREEIAIFLEYPKSWCATNGDVRSPGDTPLMAAMRCYVRSKLGEEINLTKEMTA